RAAGVPEERIVLDPGIGFFRDAGVVWHAWDVAVLAGLPALAALGRPLCVGVSRKSFVGAITGRDDPAARLPGSLAATAAAVLGGAGRAPARAAQPRLAARHAVVLLGGGAGRALPARAAARAHVDWPRGGAAHALRRRRRRDGARGGRDRVGRRLAGRAADRRAH